MRKIISFFCPKNRKIGILAIICSLIATISTAFIRMYFLYKSVPEYKELVAGYSTWSGYYKKGDMILANHLIFGIIGFYFLFSILFNLMSQRLRFLRNDWDRTFLSDKHKKQMKRLIQLFYLLVFTQFSLGILGRGITFLFPSLYIIITKYFNIAQLLLIISVCILWLHGLKNNKTKGIDAILFGSQVILPFIFFEITRFEYVYRGNILLQYNSNKFILIGSVTAVFFVIYILYKRKKSPDVKIYLSSYLSLAVFASYTLPRGTISGTPLELLHYGEFSVPFHQFINFGIFPYIDTMPMHGICNYFQGAIGYLFFDGTYASFEAAMVIGSITIAVITALIIYYFVESKSIGLLCILWFSLLGDQYYYVRWAFVLPFILIVFSKKSRENFSRLLWNWVFLSILSIAWNPSIGGACALAVMPFIIYEAFHEKGYLVFKQLWKKRRYSKKWLISYGFLFVFGLCFIPVFLEILRYVIESSTSALETAGDILKEELTEPFVWYATFGFIIPLLFSLYYCIQKKENEKKLALFGSIFLFVFNIVIVKYTFLRTQFGERGIIATTICCLFLILVVFLPSVIQYWEKETMVMLIFLLLLTGITRGTNLWTMPQRLFARETISQEYKYVEGKKIGISFLGNIFIKEDLKNELISLNYLANEVCNNKYQFVDMTNQISHYVILNKKALLPFSSSYNTSNEITQTISIQVLNDLNPEVIVVSPEWRHDAGALSTRNYHLYQWLMQHDYTPCKYESILFLTNNPGIREQYASAYEEFGQIMHLEEIKMLPTVWAGQKLREHNMEKAEAGLFLADTNSQVLSDGNYQIEGEDTFFLYALAEPVSGKEIDFLRIRAEFPNAAEECSYQGVVYFMEEGKGIKESRRFIYDGGAREVVIPLSTSPYWSYSDKNQMIMVNFIGSQLTGTQVNLELEFEKYTGPGRDQK